MDFKPPRITSGIVPPAVEYQALKEEAEQEKAAERDRRDLRRFIVTTVIGVIAAVASIVAAVVSTLTYLGTR